MPDEAPGSHLALFPPAAVAYDRRVSLTVRHARSATLAAVSALALAAALAACPSAAPPRPLPVAAVPDASPPAPTEILVSVVGTNDLHGHIAALPWLGGYVANLRRARERDGGVLLLDGGDMFQGTLESNLLEGASVVAGYNALGYTAVAVGNHEFDFGPVGEAAVPRAPGDDPRGALKALAASARFPFLCANLRDKTAGAHPGYPNMPRVTTVSVRGVKIGLVGVTTSQTPRTTIAANFAGLEVAPLVDTIRNEALALRAGGAAAVIVLAHAGSKCERFTGDAEHDGCDLDEEIAHVTRALPGGLVDLVVAGHTHAGVAHRLSGVPVIESFSYGRAFGRADLVIRGGRVETTRIHAPRDLCAGGKPPAPEGAGLGPCDAGDYEGAPVTPDARVRDAVTPGLEIASKKRGALLGPTATSAIRRSYDHPSPLGDLFADLLREATRADVAFMNGGGLRASLPKGPVTYGALFEAFPFDNRVARVKLTGRELRGLFARHVAASRGGILSVSGVRVTPRCERGRVTVDLARDKGGAVKDDETLTVAMSDFLATGGDHLFQDAAHEGRTTIEDAAAREVIAVELGKRKELSPDAITPSGRPRIALPGGARPFRCER